MVPLLQAKTPQEPIAQEGFDFKLDPATLQHVFCLLLCSLLFSAWATGSRVHTFGFPLFNMDQEKEAGVCQRLQFTDVQGLQGCYFNQSMAIAHVPDPSVAGGRRLTARSSVRLH